MVSSSVATLSCERAAAAWRSRGRIWRRTSRTRSPRRSRFSAVPASRRSARSRRRRCLSTPAASSMMARRSSGRALSTVSSWPWPMIMCCWRPTPESESSSWTSSRRQGAPLMAYSLSPERKSVRVMVTSARSMGSFPEALSMVSETSARPRAGARRGPGENDVLHFGRAQRAGALGPEDPGDGVDDVGLATAVGADHDGDARLELQHGGVGERLEPLHAERLQEHRGDPSGPERTPASGIDRLGPGQTWQCSQKKVERPPVLTRTIVLRQRRQAWPSRS